jgi:hypothetical protein
MAKLLNVLLIPFLATSALWVESRHAEVSQVHDTNAGRCFLASAPMIALTPEPSPEIGQAAWLFCIAPSGDVGNLWEPPNTLHLRNVVFDRTRLQFDSDDSLGHFYRLAGQLKDRSFVGTMEFRRTLTERLYKSWPTRASEIV